MKRWHFSLPLPVHPQEKVALRTERSNRWTNLGAWILQLLGIQSGAKDAPTHVSPVWKRKHTSCLLSVLPAIPTCASHLHFLFSQHCVAQACLQKSENRTSSQSLQGTQIFWSALSNSETHKPFPACVTNGRLCKDLWDNTLVLGRGTVLEMHLLLRWWTDKICSDHVIFFSWNLQACKFLQIKQMKAASLHCFPNDTTI